ncbi:MAG TPA: signal recognition particle-docking protein FtsY [Acidimicrobiales bacterium]|nr:signal recognition particle-docking protein FtsY [Acidimicrobiales bacterium]
MIAVGAMTASDAAVAVLVAVPVLVVAAGVAVGLRLRGRGPKPTVPSGETASDAATDVELARAAELTRSAEGAPVGTVVADAPTVFPEPSAADFEEGTVAAEAAPVEAPEAPEEKPEEKEEAAPATYRGRLGKARGLLAGYLGSVRRRGRIDAETWDDLEEALIRADVGVGATDALLGDLRQRVKAGEIDGPDTLLAALRTDLVAMLSPPSADGRPTRDEVDAPGVGPGDDGDRRVDVWLFVGVNGVGKTTTVGKLASRLRADGSAVLLAAGDTFRAAAADQLATWASRVDADLVRGAEGGDPGAVIFDAVQRAASKGHSVVLADTAGRLHNKVNLIEELKKIRRVADRAPGRVVEVLLVLDATTGQNGLAQAKVFLDAVEVSGVVLTKLDGTAKGGIVVAIQRELGLPVKLVGLGEGVGDLVDFDPEAFVDALF